MRVILGVTALFLTVAVAAEPLRICVSPEGNDAFPGTPVAPCASPARAQQIARQVLAAGKAPEGIIVCLRAGTYQLADTLRLGPEDSGTEKAPVTYRAYPGEKVTLLGGKAITGWRPYKGKILQCDLGAQGWTNPAFRQLFFYRTKGAPGERMTLARYPNVNPDDPHGGTWAHVLAVEGDENRTEFTYAADVEHNWAKPTAGEVCIFPGFDWAWNIIPIAKVDRAQKLLTLSRGTSYALRAGDRYFVQGLLEELDSPGEWYLDKATATLYFWPPSDITKGQVVAPRIDTVIEAKGANHVTLRGYTIEACDGDAVRIADCNSSRVAACTIRNCGGWGVTVSGGKNSGAFGNDISACGRGGIAISGGDRKTLTPGGNYARNNYCHHFAVYERTYNTGINCDGVGNVVANNLVHDAPHAGLIVGGNDNTIEYNIVHHVNLQSADTGGIYFCSRDWTQRGNTIRYNIFHDIGGYGKSWTSKRRGKIEFAYPHFTWGIYLDDPTTGTTVFGNILYRVPICGLHNHGGRDNTWENNIVVDCPALNAGMLWDGWSEWPAIFERLKAAQVPGSPYLRKYPELAAYNETNPAAMTGVKVLHNIFYYTTEGTAWLRGENPSWGENTQLLYSMNMQKTDFPRNQWDYNLVSTPTDMKLLIQLGLQPEPGRGMTWDEWQKLADQHSLRADPHFVNPQAHDYRLQPDSPALKLGFKPIPVDKIGPFKDDLRALWPVVEAPGASRFGDLVTFDYVDLPEYQLLPAKPFVVRNGIGKFLARCAKGGPAKVAYFGGGIHPADGWRAGLMKWLRDRYPGAKIDEIDCSINDCVRGSSFNFWRYQHDVLAQSPDLVLVDFASDDSQTEPREIMRAIEAVTRWTRQAAAPPDLVFLYAFRQGFEDDYKDGNSPLTISSYEKIAQHYGVPSIDMAYHVADLSRQGKLLIKATGAEQKASPDKLVFSRTGVVPLPDGNKVYLEAITAALSEMARGTGVPPAGAALPKLYCSGDYTRARQVPITREMLSGDWTELPATDPLVRGNARYFDSIWLTKQPGAKLTFPFRGTAASIFNFMGPDTGKAKVTVDGKDVGIRTQVDPWAWYQRLASLSLASGLPDGEHTVTVELLPDAPDRSVPIATARQQASARQLATFDMSVFEGIALRLGCLRIMGELL